LARVSRHRLAGRRPPAAANRLQSGGRWLLCLLAAVIAVCPAAASADTVIVARPGQPVSEVIDAWRQQGIPFAYTTELVTGNMLVQEQLSGTDPVEMVSRLLEPYRLQIFHVEGLLVIGRQQPPRATRAGPRPAVGANGNETIAEVTVSASRYEILRELTSAPSLISQRTIQQLPLLGDDPLRAVQRLPGNASSGASAKSHLRGSEQHDTGLVLNGQRLLDPFHVRDYQNLFSAIDSRAINGIEVYTGGFPVQYGDGIGGLVLIDTVTPERDRHTELGLSVYNSSVLSAGRAAGGDLEWLFSARRGNLDLVLNQELGEPSYNDVFAEIGINLSSATHLSINGLVATDNVLAVTEADPDEREASVNDTRNAQFWLSWTQDWSDNLSSYTTLSTSALNSDRSGSADDDAEIIAAVSDQRDINISGLQQDWSFALNGRHQLSFGAAFRRIEGDFRYQGSADYFGAFARFRGVPTSINRDLDLHVRGDSLAAYIADRWQLGERTALELGLRWDKQSYTDAGDNEQLSPRVSLLHSLSKDTDLRISAGRYYQSQAVNELQVEDGVSRFAPAQRADQFIASIQHRLNARYSLRAEAYYKQLDSLRPRFENLLDPLAVMPELKPDRIRIAPDSARASGIELSLAFENDAGLSWWASYTLAQVEDRVAGSDIARSWDQRHALQTGVLWQDERWDLSMVLNGHSGWPKTTLLIAPGSDPADPELMFSDRNSRRFSPFLSLDLRVARRIPVKVGEMSWFFEVSNASNRQNACCIDFELDEDSGPTPQLQQHDEYWFPLLPAIGILWEF
jgi:outer membrane receptor protein involved in Fe transport